MTENTTSPRELSRRAMLRRGAVVGGALVWATPVVQSIASPAFAAGTPQGNTQDISFVALLLRCNGTLYRAKFDAPYGSGTLTPTETGRGFAVDGCAEQLMRGDTSVSRQPPPGITATFNPANGQLTVNLGTCTLLDFVVKCGIPSEPTKVGCEDPGEDGNQPTIGAGGLTGSVTFKPCILG